MSILSAGSTGEKVIHHVGFFSDKYECQGDLKCVWCGLSSGLSEETNGHLGTILTFMDAMLPEGQQNKAAKDTLRSMIWDMANQMRKRAETMISYSLMPKENKNAERK